MITLPVFFNVVKEDILDIEALMRSQADGNSTDLRNALDTLLKSGGKRIRPTITVLVGRMLGAPRDQLITLAAAIELLHTATLVHDDLIDGSLLRRGMPTLNSHWSPGATILTGDFLFARAAELAAQANSIPAMRLFAQTLSEIVSGEITQLFGGICKTDLEHYYSRIYAKTASLIRTAASVAALISPVPEETVQDITLFGREIGMAFQIVDDILDFTGEQATMGKPVGSDLRQGLVTLPTLFYIEKHPDDIDGQTLLSNNCLQNDQQVERIVNAIRQSSAIQACLDEAKGFVSRGLVALQKQPPSPEKQYLQELANFIVLREI